MSEKTTSREASLTKRTTGELAKAAVSGWLGTAMEFMDFQLYSLAAAIVFNKIFFPDVSPMIGLIAAMATYGVGYVARLVGAIYFGRMGDRIGRKKVLIIGGAGVAVLHFPMTWLLHDAAWQLFVSMSVMLVFIACSAAIVPAAYAEMFPAHIRTVGVGVPYSICVALFGGTAPYLQQLFSDVFHQSWMFNVYAVLMVLVSILTVLGLPETKGKDLRH